jgi:hypothetical protein
VFVIQFSTQEVLLFRNAKTREVVVGAEDRVEQCTYFAAVTRAEEELSNELTGGWKVIEVCCSFFPPWRVALLNGISSRWRGGVRGRIYRYYRVNKSSSSVSVVCVNYRARSCAQPSPLLRGVIFHWRLQTAAVWVNSWLSRMNADQTNQNVYNCTQVEMPSENRTPSPAQARLAIPPAIRKPSSVSATSPPRR